MNKAYASHYAAGRVLCAGDSVHRHPPNNGLGSNTSIQDAYNLAWKLAYVIKGISAPTLLDTYSPERAPVGKEIVTRAIKSIGETKALLSVFEPDGESGALDLSVLFEDGVSGASTRSQLAQAIARKNYEFNCLGVEANILYNSSAVIGSMADFEPEDKINAAFHSRIMAGARFPHAWVTRKGIEISTLELLGKGKFTLIAGCLGDAWISAAKRFAGAHGIPLATWRIGAQADVQDIYFDLHNRIGFTDTSIALIRPDGHIAWAGTLEGNPEQILEGVLRLVLHLPHLHLKGATQQQKELA
ncbi:FAD-dependent monooxygenase [Pseudomonas sp.]|uniref:FAD-dependent monooxygenase n=1 Tax=Pseudomonas sp. TaxID=306 RepID=UPI003D6F503C